MKKFLITFLMVLGFFLIKAVHPADANTCWVRLIFGLLLLFCGILVLVIDKKTRRMPVKLCAAWMFCVAVSLWINLEGTQKNTFSFVGIVLLQSVLLFLAMNISNQCLGTNCLKGCIPIVLSVFAFYFLSLCLKSRLPMYLFFLCTGVISVINCLVVQVRGTPVLADDFYAIRTALNVVKQYRLVLDEYSLLVVGILILLFWSVNNLPNALPIHPVTSIVAAVFCFALFWLGPWYRNVNLKTWNTRVLVSQNGYYSTLIGTLKLGMIGPPDGYSLEEIDHIVMENQQSETESSNEQPPNIIVIMNESLTDLNIVGDFAASEDFMPFIHSLDGDNVIKNWLVTSKGGGTSITESEFLLSTSKANYWESLPFIRNIKTDTPSLVTVLKEQGYYTVGMHPAKGSNYSRSTVYPCLGFDAHYFTDNLEFDTENLFNNNISDRSNYAQIIKLYENRPKEQPFFCFNVTIQNHGPYVNSEAIKITSFDAKEDVEHHLACIKESDQAFRELVTYFREQENTIILMFGDHHPALDDRFYETLLGKKMEAFSEEDFLKVLTVPYVLWANYDIDVKDPGRISTNYLAPFLLAAAGLKMSDFQSYVWSMHDKLPVVHGGGCIDAAGTIYHYDGTDYPQWSSEYRLLTYNYLFDYSHRKEAFFHIQEKPI